MSDASVHAALRSAATLVAVEAPGGCGKTYQGAAYARDIADTIGPGRLLILTHTHAACSVFHGRTRGLGSHVEIRTIDSLVSQLTDAYQAGIGLPPDTATWARHNADGYDHLAVKAAALLKRYPSIAACLARRYPIVICDEHQDSNGERHAIVMSLHDQRARLRIFADPMQRVFRIREYGGGCAPLDWTALIGTAHAFEQLDVPHRWDDGCKLLGQWILDARTTLKDGGKVDLRAGVPPSVSVVFADNNAHGNLEYRPVPGHRGPIDAFERTSDSLLILARHNDTTFGLRPTFTRRIPLWEGHVRSDLENFVDALKAGHGNKNAVAKAVVGFVQATTTGFNAAGFANILQEDVANGCARTRRQRPAKVQDLARLIVAEPNHLGAAKVVARIAELRAADADFRQIQLDCHKEFHEAARLRTFDTAEIGLQEISRHRTYSRPQPPDKAISTIHKAKGLECKNVIIMPCDAKSFPDNDISRCLLYVAMSRASHRLMLVIPRAKPSPLLIIS